MYIRDGPGGQPTWSRPPLSTSGITTATGNTRKAEGLEVLGGAVEASQCQAQRGCVTPSAMLRRHASIRDGAARLSSPAIFLAEAEVLSGLPFLDFSCIILWKLTAEPSRVGDLVGHETRMKLEQGEHAWKLGDRGNQPI